MGNTCSGQQAINQIEFMQFKRQTNKFVTKRITQTDRFRHQIQKLKMDGTNMYRLILPVDGQRQQSKIIQCEFLFSYADMEMCQCYQFNIQDLNRFPIIDVYQPQNIPNPQIYHKIATYSEKRKLMKYYNFRQFTNYYFKCGLYELSLYLRIPKSPLQDHFIIYKGNIKQLVMIFDYCYVSLHDVLYYRKITNYDWTQLQLLLIMKMLCDNLIQLGQVNVVHRDIRPSNIFFNPISIINSGQSNLDMYSNNPKYLLNQTVYKDRFYTIFNLQSARVVDVRNKFHSQNLPQNMDMDLDLLTVKGAPLFSDKNVKTALQNDQHKANYNPYQNDIILLKNTLISLVNLQPSNQPVRENRKLNIFKNRQKIKKLINFIEDNLKSQSKLTIQRVSQQVDDLLKISPTHKSQSYYDQLRKFYIKQLTICQNIQANLYFNYIKRPIFLNNQQLTQSVNAQSINNLSTDYKPNSQQPNYLSIDSRYQIIQKNNQAYQYIQTLYIKTLYDLHKKDTFVSFMLQKLNRNFQLNRKQQNVYLLMNIGMYFEQAGVRQNQYYKQAILLLMELAQKQRLQGFYKDHNRLVRQAQQIFFKFNPTSKMIPRAKCMLLKQRAYKQLYQISQNQVSYELAKNLFGGNNFNNNANSFFKVQQTILQAYEQSKRANLPIQEQLQLIFAKGQISLKMGNIQEAQAFLYNGYQISQKNYKQFLTAHNCSKYKGMFQYAIANLQMQKIKPNPMRGVSFLQRQPKTIFEIQQRLQRAKQRFSSVKIHPVLVIKCYIALGDLHYFREDKQNSRRNYQRALNLLQAENQLSLNQNKPISRPTSFPNIQNQYSLQNQAILQNQQLTQGYRSISARIQLQIVSKLVNVLNELNNTVQVQQYENLYNKLKRQYNLNRKTQSKYSRKNKTDRMSNSHQSNNNLNTSMSASHNSFRNTLRNNNINLDIIQEEDKQNQMFQSSPNKNLQSSHCNQSQHLQPQNEINHFTNSRILQHQQQHAQQQHLERKSHSNSHVHQF